MFIPEGKFQSLGRDCSCSLKSLLRLLLRHSSVFPVTSSLYLGHSLPHVTAAALSVTLEDVTEPCNMFVVTEEDCHGLLFHGWLLYTMYLFIHI